MTPIITAFERSPDRGRGLARDMPSCITYPLREEQRTCLAALAARIPTRTRCLLSLQSRRGRTELSNWEPRMGDLLAEP
jgi:hypothetical protein